MVCMDGFTCLMVLVLIEVRLSGNKVVQVWVACHGLRCRSDKLVWSFGVERQGGSFWYVGCIVSGLCWSVSRWHKISKGSQLGAGSGSPWVW
jgi:hypothetical protein